MMPKPPLNQLAAELYRAQSENIDPNFRRALKQVICFPLVSAGAIVPTEVDVRDSPSLNVGSFDPDLTLQASNLDNELEQCFFADLWVPRIEISRIQDKLSERSCLIVLTGEKGAGKSTIVRYLYRNLRDFMPQTAGILADVRSMDHILKVKRASGDLDLCSSVYESLVDTLLFDNLSARGRWHSYLVDHESHFFGLRTLSSRETDPIQRLDSLVRSNRETYDNAMLAFNEERGSHKLSLFLKFVKTEDHLGRVLFIDNVDQYTNDFQVNVARHLNELVEHQLVDAAVVTLRPENYNRVKLALDGLSFVNHIELDPLYGPDEDAMNSRNPPAEDKFFFEFLDKRLTFLSDRLPHISSDSKSSAANELGVLQSSLENIRRFTRTVDNFADLTRWYNGSARAAAYSFLGLLNRAVLETETIWQDDLGPAVERLARERRLVRSLVYRNMILDDDETVLPPSAPMLYSSDYPTCSPPAVPFLELHLLHYLGSSRGTNVLEVERHGVQVLRTPPERTRQSLTVLWEGRGIDETGLIHIDQSRMGHSLRNDAEVRMLRSGRFMRSSLAPSCEYLFWSALAHPAADSFIPETTSSITELIRRDDLRLFTAIRFAKRWIYPQLLAFRRDLESNSEDQWNHYRQSYPEGFVESRISWSLSQFFQGLRRIDQDQKSTLTQMINEIRNPE